MNIVFLYGPPASGKLTVAEILAKLTGYRLFHNHLTQDLAREIYPAFDETRFGLVDILRLDVIEYAVANGTNIIVTYVYGGVQQDDSFIAKVIRTVTTGNGKVLFVELTAPDNVLIERVNNESRKRFHKLTDSNILRAKLENREYSASIPSQEVYKIDTSSREPEYTARKIIEHYRLPHLQ